MNTQRTAESVKVLLLFGLLMLCGIDLETPSSDLQVAVGDAASVACEQDAGCAPEELWSDIR